MNNGKVCISICARTAEELFEKVRLAEPLADLTELRFDCLAPGDVERARTAVCSREPIGNYITTFRPFEQGGARHLSLDERRLFWSWSFGTKVADVEEDLVEDTFSFLWPERICSYHDFKGVPKDLADIFRRLSSTNAEIIKIAAKVEDAVEAIPLWKLIALAKKDHRQIIPIAMGEAGKWTRILGPAHGAYLTYAALESGSETAPGQISADDLIDVYRVKELDKATEVYGIIAGDTSYSMSPYIHNAAFKAARRNAVFVPFQVSDLDQFILRMVRPKTREVELNLRGFSVTNPHKRGVISHLDEIDEAARKIGAVNTIKIVDGRLHGHNTDADGFIKPLKTKFRDLSGARVAVLGAGGAARACVYKLINESARVTVFARNATAARELAGEFGAEDEQLTADFSDFDIVVNATPIGTQGELQNETMAKADQLSGVKFVYDLVYNPAETRLLHEAKLAGAATLGGFDMLIAQAARQFEIWTGQTAPIETMRTAARKKLNER